MWSMVAQRLIQITPPAARLDQLWQCVEAALSAVPQEHIQSLFVINSQTCGDLCRDNDLQQWRLVSLLILAGTTLHRSL
ncbi:transposable element Tcb1 transposase [Trichonephila clavipes]|nr:transposable element Tcb1 transposase [Trichonephila clavipes]